MTTTVTTRYFTTKIKTEDMVSGNGSDALIFCITEEKPSIPSFTESMVGVGFFVTWEQAGEQAKAQTLPVVYVSLSGTLKHYGDLFDVDAYERAVYAHYVNRVNAIREGDPHFREPLNREQWLPILRDAVQFCDADSVARILDDNYLLCDYDRYQQELLARTAVKLPTAAEQLEARRQQPVREEGVYQDASGNVFKVICSSYDRLYAKQLIDGKFEYAPGALRRLTAADKLSLTQAEQYGKLTGRCCRCGARLTDETSISRGVGPVCATYF